MSVKHFFALLFLFLSCFTAIKAQEKKDSALIANDINKIYDKPEIKASIDSIMWRKHLYKQMGQFLLQPS